MSSIETSFANSIDGYEMVLVSEGEAIFGSCEDDPDAQAPEMPQFRAYLPSYYLGKYPVRNKEYQRFLLETGHPAPDQTGWSHPIWRGRDFSLEFADHPVVSIFWDDAIAYCGWAGLRLPAELEWEKAARGLHGLRYSWGNEWDPRKCRNDSNRDRMGTCAVWEYPDGCGEWGHFQMVGNVWEWCQDWWDPQAYHRYAAGDLRAPDDTGMKVLRGGSWVESKPGFFRCTERYSSFRVPVAASTFGFRCARDANR